MKYSDIHIHGYYSDGKGWPVEFAEKALQKNIYNLGFSDHTPIPIENSWSMKLESLENYVSNIEKIKIDFNNKLNIYLGIELDYIEKIDVKKYIEFDKLQLDYFLGAVHYLYSEKLDKYLEVDGTEKEFDYLVMEGFEGDIRKTYAAYYNNARNMIKEYKPKVIAHMDVIVKNNRGSKFFNEKDNEYITEVEKTLDVVKEYNVYIEINPGGMAKGYMDRPYPSEYILKRCLEKKIAITINSDAHIPRNIAFRFGRIIEDIKELGFTEAMIFNNGVWEKDYL